MIGTMCNVLIAIHLPLSRRILILITTQQSCKTRRHLSFLPFAMGENKGVKNFLQTFLHENGGWLFLQRNKRNNRNSAYFDIKSFLLKCLIVYCFKSASPLPDTCVKLGWVKRKPNKSNYSCSTYTNQSKSESVNQMRDTSLFESTFT